MTQKIYPFKFLNAYQREDKHLFFGREEEINALYEMVFQTDLLLVYGASGTGKSSLIQCGLAGRFESHDWLPVYVRRGSNLNESFARELEKVGGGNAAETETDLDWLGQDWEAEETATVPPKSLSALEKRFKAVYVKHFKPVYLIFDQFEELYILGNKDEQEQFVATVKEILKVEQPVKIILSIREEYLGELYEFEKAVPELLRKKLRVEPMNLDKVRTVLNGINALKNGNVSLAAGEEDAVVQRIFDKVKGKEKTLSIQLPYLQVFLDKLYLHITGDEARQTDAQFSLAEMEKIGDIGDILRDFLDDQVGKIAQTLAQTPETIWKILSPFVTLEGTKEPIFEAQLHTRLPELKTATLQAALQEFVSSRILRFNESEQEYEITHDSLAKQIHARRSDEEIALMEVQRLIKTQVLLKAEVRDFFSEKQLLFMEPFLPNLALEAAESEWIEQSKTHLQAQKAAEAARQAAELEKAKAEAEKEANLRTAAERASQRARTRSRIAIAVAIVAFIASVLALQQYSHASSEKKKAQSLALTGAANVAFYKYRNVTKSLRYAQYALAKDSNNVAAQAALYTIAYLHPNRVKLPFYYSYNHTGEVNSARFSPDGRKVVSASSDGTVKIWDTTTGALLADLKGHTQNVNSARFSLDGRKVVSASSDGSVRIWDASTGALLADLKTNTAPINNSTFGDLRGYFGGVNSADFSPDGCRVISAGQIIQLWDASTGALLADLKGHISGVNSASFSPDGSKVISASRGDTTVKLWDASTGALLADLKGHKNWVNSASFSPDGRKVVSASWDGTVKLWDASTGAPLADLKVQPGSSNSASFSPDGSKVVSTGGNTLQIWDASTGALLTGLKGHTGDVRSANFSHDGSKVVSASWDQTVKTWNASTGELLADLRGHTNEVWSASFSPDGSKVASASLDNTVKIWDVSRSSFGASMEFKGHEQCVNSAYFSPDGRKVLSASGNVSTDDDNNLKIWDASSGTLLVDLKGHKYCTNSASFSPSGGNVVSASHDKTVKIWDAITGELLIDLIGHTDAVNNANFSPDISKVVSASSDGTIKIWDVLTGRLLADLKGDGTPVHCASFSPDGSKVVSASGNIFWSSYYDDNTVKIWDTRTGALLADLKGHTGAVCSASFSPDGHKVVSASLDKTIKIWDARTGALLADLKGHINGVNSASFSPDGRKVVSASWDRTVKLWDATTGALLADLKGHEQGVKSASFSPDGRKVVSASCDNTVKIWEVDIPTIIQRLGGLMDDLSAEEKAKYGVGEE